MQNHRIKLWMGSILLTLAMAACGPTTAPSQATAVPPAPTAPTAEEAAQAPTAEATAETATEAPAATETPAEAPTQPTAEAGTSEAVSVEGCPTAAEGQTVVINAANGYCFLVPAGYTTDYDLVVYAPETTEGHRERALIEVTPAEGRSAAEIADALVAEVADLDGIEIERSTLSLDGVEAHVLDGMPGQDINRRVIAVTNDRAYSLMFVPLAPQDAPEATAQMEELYALMVESFRFVTPSAEAAPALPDSDPLLTWQGEIDGACHTLSVWANGVTQAGVCGDAPSVTGQLRSPTAEWDAIQNHFGNIDAETAHGTITFAGSGEATSAEWADALATWAWFAAGETISGRPSAAGRTVLAWQMDEIADQPGQCAQLIVLAYGYAYANQIPCEGSGPTTLLAQGWLTDAELGTFATWVSDHTRVDDAAGYLDAQGDAPLTAAEIEPFAAALHERLAATADGS